MLPIDEYSWKFFAFELFHICQERCGLPKDIHNEVKKIEHCNKNIALAYYEVFHTWYRLMASDAELDHIEKSLQRFENGFIMQEFKLIKSNPPVRNQCPRQEETTVTLWDRPDMYMQHSSSLVDCMQRGSLYEREETQRYRLHHMREQQFIQFTNVSDAAAPLEISKTTLHRSSIPRLKERQFKGCRSYQKLNDSYSKRNNKVWQEKRKVKKNIKTAVKMRHLVEQNDTLKNENITLIKKILPYGMIPVSRQEYNTFLDHTVHVIMEHNNVTKWTVLSLAYKAYDEIAETNNGDRFVLHNGTTNMKLDKEQYECLDFYVKHARTRVLRELMELGEHGDTSFLFITYDGKSALQTYQRKQSVLRKTTNASRRVATSPFDGGDVSPLSANSETGDIEFDNTFSNKTITKGTTSYATKQWNEHHTGLDENKFYSSDKQNLSAISTRKQNPSAISTGKQNSSAVSTGIQNPSAISNGKQNSSAMSTGKQNSSAVSTGIQNASAISTGKQNTSVISTGKQNSSLTKNYSETETLEYEYCVDDNQRGTFTEVAMAKRLSDVEHFKVENETAAHSRQLCDNVDCLEMSACLASKHENVGHQTEGMGENENKYSKLEDPLEDFLKEIDIELECSTYM
ncbi:uncharacterized protein LOC128553216 [Mercenaria mercenaria]|uniref:uncharacterized protein LOC128553216 n=1 Tax=Mercenaria mercenaria TaxID=6596 RepID=UPI00234E778C|nr:uncharacterized protein LOC128553216 [Mercenaria mercenaria]